MCKKGYKHSEEARQKVSAARLGKRLTLETRQKISAAKVGKRLTLETRQKLSVAATGKRPTPEVRQRMSAAQKSRFQDDEIKQKQKEIFKAYYKTEEGTTVLASNAARLLEATVLTFTIKSPKGLTYTATNLLKFVRDHPELFNPEDCVPRRANGHCRASAGLYTLTNDRNAIWKGWTLVDKH